MNFQEFLKTGVSIQTEARGMKWCFAIFKFIIMVSLFVVVKMLELKKVISFAIWCLFYGYSSSLMQSTQTPAIISLLSDNYSGLDNGEPLRRQTLLF